MSDMALGSLVQVPQNRMGDAPTLCGLYRTGTDCVSGMVMLVRADMSSTSS
jgi:hypothetical protein